MKQSHNELDILTIENEIKSYLNAHSSETSDIPQSIPLKNLFEKNQAHAIDLPGELAMNHHNQQKLSDPTQESNSEKKKRSTINLESLTYLLQIKSDLKFLNQTYQLILNRAPDFEGFTYQIDLLKSGLARETVLYKMLNSDEFKKNNPDFSLPSFLIPQETQPKVKFSFKNKMLNVYKKFQRISSVYSKLKQLLNLPKEHHDMMDALNASFYMINLQLEKIAHQDQEKFQKLLAKIHHTDNRIKNVNSDIHHRMENIRKQFDPLNTKIDHSTDRSINVTHFHYEKYISQMDAMCIQLRQLQNQLQKISEQLEV